MARSSTALVTGVTFVATLGGLLFGYDTAVISGAVSSIDANFIDPQHLTETARSSLSGWTVSSALFGCIIGALIAAYFLLSGRPSAPPSLPSPPELGRCAH